MCIIVNKMDWKKRKKMAHATSRIKPGAQRGSDPASPRSSTGCPALPAAHQHRSSRGPTAQPRAHQRLSRPGEASRKPPSGPAFPGSPSFTKIAEHMFPLVTCWREAVGYVLTVCTPRSHLNTICILQVDKVQVY